MNTFSIQAAQGDMLITKINELPEGLISKKLENGVYVLAHSETGHHHIIEPDNVAVYEAANDPFLAYMLVEHPTQLKHLRSFDTHHPITISPGTYRINRQREYTPDGFRRAAD